MIQNTSLPTHPSWLSILSNSLFIIIILCSLGIINNRLQQILSDRGLVITHQRLPILRRNLIISKHWLIL